MHKISLILQGIIRNLCDREKVGMEKYGTTVDRKDYTARDWLEHNYQELLDAAVYNRALDRELAEHDERVLGMTNGVMLVINGIDSGRITDIPYIQQLLKECVFNHNLLIARQMNRG